MSGPTAVVKRALLGRPYRSSRMRHTLPPKRVALPVFASDALSSVAYAPDEIPLTLSIAGAGAYFYSPWIAAAVAVVMATVVASYRQNVRAYPSGGGDSEVATVNLGHRAGLAVATSSPSSSRSTCSDGGGRTCCTISVRCCARLACISSPASW